MSTSSFPPPPPPPPSQFGAPVFPQTTSASGQVLMSSSASPPTSVATSSAPSTPCCDTGRPILMDPHTGQTVCSCQYSPPVSGAPPPPGAAAAGLLAAYPRIPGLPEGLYNSPYAAAAAAAAAAASQGLMPLSADPSAFYPAMGAYDLKSLAASSPMYAYDPNMGAYPYPNGFLDPNARRKNATRESTQTLKAWLAEHKKNPYPTKGEKIMLAIITKMTLTQVSTWFANARRRLKKENKMTWEPRNRADDEDDDDDKMDSDTERTDIGRVDDDDDMEEIDIGTESEPEDSARHISDSRRLMENLATTHALHSLAAAAAAASSSSSVISSPPSLAAPLPPPGLPHLPPRTSTPTSSPPVSPHPSASPLSTSRSSPAPPPAQDTHKDSVIKCSTPGTDSNTSNTTTPSTTKPKIWSMADIATSSHTSSSASSASPPPPSAGRPRTPPRMALHHTAPRPPLHPGFPYTWPGLPYGLPPHLVPQVSTAALLSRYGLVGAMGAMGGGAPTMVTSSAASAFCRPPIAVAPGGERRELHATGVKSSSPAESSPAPLHTAFRPVPKSKPTQPIHV